MEVVNVKNSVCEIWGARWGKYPGSKHLLNTQPFEKGWLGNPYIIGQHGDRNDVIELYQADFLKKLKFNHFVDALRKIKGKKVGCFCKPADCHLDIVADWIKENL